MKTGWQRLKKSYKNYFRDHPVMSLGIAVAAGFLLSRVFSDCKTDNRHESRRRQDRRLK